MPLDSRLYTGLHWPMDVLVGILLAVIILVIAVRIQTKISELSPKIQWVLAILVPFFIVIVFTEEEGIKYAGFLLGAGIGYLLEAKQVRMIISQKVSKKIIAYCIGIIGLFALQVGLKMILPEHIIYDFIRYGLIGLWGLLVAPYVFVKLKIYQADHNILIGKGNVSV